MKSIKTWSANYGLIVWLAIIIIGYIIVSLQKIPLFSRFAIFGSVIIASSILPFKLKNKAYLVPLALSFLVLISFIFIPIFGGTIKDLLAFCWIFILSIIIGKRILELIIKDYVFFWLEKFILAAALGFGFFSLLILGFAALHIIYVKVIYTVMILLSLIFSKDIFSSCKKTWMSARQSFPAIKKLIPSPLMAALISIVLIMILVNFLGALAPETRYDGLNYHLTVPKFYLMNHGLINLPNIFQSYFAKSIEMLYLLGLTFSGQIAAKLFSFAFGILMILTIICIGRRFFSLQAGMLGAVLFYTCPLVGWLSVTVYNELAICFYTTTTLLIFLIWQENKQRMLLLLCGILAAFTLSAKLYAFLPLFLMGLLIIFLDWQRTKNKRKIFLLDLLTFVCPILLLALPWFWVTYSQTGNPIFPFFNAIFKSPFMPAANSFMDLKNFGMGNNVKDFLLLPWNITYHSAIFGAERNGSMGIVFLAALPAFFFLRKSRVITLMLATSIGSIIIWFFIGQYTRYLIPEFALFSLLTAYLFYYFFTRNNSLCNIVFQALILIYIFFTALVYLNINGNIPSKVALGIESRDQYLTRKIHIYPTAQYLNKRYNADNIKVFLFGSEDRYYIDAMTYNNNSLNMTDFPSDSNKIADYLKQKGITHALVDIKSVKEEKAKTLDDALVKAGKAQIEYSDKNTKLYKLSVKSAECILFVS